VDIFEAIRPELSRRKQMNNPDGNKIALYKVRLLENVDYAPGNVTLMLINNQEVKVFVDKRDELEGTDRVLRILRITRVDTMDAVACIFLNHRLDGIGTDDMVGRPIIENKLLDIPLSRPLIESPVAVEQERTPWAV
jgi:hypothetical protein